jgi:hypothetical protein
MVITLDVFNQVNTGCCFLASLTVFFRKDSPAYLRHLSFFLFLNVAVETAANILAATGSNTWLYNIFVPLSFIFYSYLFSKIIFSPKIKKLIRVFWIFYILLVLINSIFIEKFTVFDSYTYTTGSIVIICLTMVYFFELFRTPRSVNLLREPPFWIATALLFFNASSLPFFSIINYLGEKSTTLANSIYDIILVINIFQYSLLTIAYLCRIKKSTF